LILQNRIVEAESAEEALRSVLDLLGEEAPQIVHVKSEHRAWAVKSSGKSFDIWEAGADSLDSVKSE